MTIVTRQEECWQCGARADPSCAFTQNLFHRNAYADPLGLPIRQGHWQKRIVVKVVVPRCERCQMRNYLWAFATFVGFMGGACIGGLQFPSSGLTTIIGGILGIVPCFLGGWYYSRLRNFRSNADYPLLKQLRAQGWEEPDG